MRAPVLAVFLTLSVAPVALATAPASAQSDDDRATARVLGQDGQAALDRKDWKTAEDRFSRAEKLFHAPTLVLGLARSLVGVGKLVAAQETYNRLIREGVPAGAPAAFTKAVEDARREVELVTPRLAKVVVTVAAAGGGDVPSPRVTVDDRPLNNAALGVSRVIDPGAHVVTVTADGFKPSESRFTLAEGGASNVAVTMERGSGAAIAAGGPVVDKTTEPGSPASTTAAAGTVPESTANGVVATSSHWPMQKTLGVVGMGIGAASAIAFGVTSILAIGDHSSLSSHCGGASSGTCNAQPGYTQYVSDENAYHTMSNISLATGIAAGVFAAAGLTLYFTAPSHSEPSPEPVKAATVTPYLTPGSLGVIGTF